MTIKMKMTALIASALIAIIGIAGVSQTQLNTVFEKANYANENTVPSLTTLNEAIAAVANVRVATWQHIAQNDPAKRKDSVIQNKHTYFGLLNSMGCTYYLNLTSNKGMIV